MRARHVYLTAAASVAVVGAASGVSAGLSQSPLPATPTAPVWEPPIDLGTGGSPAGITVAVGAQGDVGVLVASHPSKGSPATLSLRRAAPGDELGTPLVLERTRGSFGPAALTFDSIRRAVAGWTVTAQSRLPGLSVGRFGLSARLRTARISSSRSFVVTPLTDGSSPVYQPTFVPGIPGPVMGWGEAQGPIRAVQWGEPAAPRRVPVALPTTGFRGSAGAGAPGGRVLSTWADGSDVIVAASEDGGKTYAPGAVVSHLRPNYLFPFVAVGTGGGGLITWSSYGARPVAASGSAVYAAVVPAAGRIPTRARRLSDPGVSVGGPSLVAAPDGGGIVGWVQGESVSGGDTVNGITTGDPVTGTIQIARVDPAGIPTRSTLGAPGELAASLRLLPDGSGGAVAVWTGPDRRLRSQAVDAVGAAGPAFTLARGIDPSSGFTAAAANGRAAVTYRAGGRLHLRVLR